MPTRAIGLVASGMIDRDRPRVAASGSTPVDAHVAAEVDAHARRARGAELVGDDVGRESLADAARIEAGAGGQPDGVGDDLDRAGAESRARSSPARGRCAELSSNERS